MPSFGRYTARRDITIRVPPSLDRGKNNSRFDFRSRLARPGMDELRIAGPSGGTEKVDFVKLARKVLILANIISSSCRLRRFSEDSCL